MLDRLFTPQALLAGDLHASPEAPLLRRPWHHGEPVAHLVAVVRHGLCTLPLVVAARPHDGLGGLRHVLEEEGDNVERRRQRALALELLDELGALKEPVEGRALL